MEEHHSILYGPINGLLIRLLGEPPVEKLSPGAAAFWFPDGKHAWIPDPAIMTLLLLAFFAVFFPLAAKSYRREKPGGVQTFLEMVVSAIRGLLEDVIGHGAGKKYIFMIGAFAIFIFAANLFGLFFFLTPPTGVLSTTVALALVSFVYFNYQGIKENGVVGYLKHFMGPVLWLAPLFFVIETISNFARILSLSLRLFMNIYGEHTATGIFSGLVPIVVPWPLMALGLFTALLQSFIFVTLTAVYISLGTAHEEH
ncbi:MAG TPA: F0F1 ATP synthase subunit A [Thermoanaerobaculia bacterium]|nr:F0F1 ATP synthase subunit A [Thermoanaerobaculia bacterium]